MPARCRARSMDGRLKLIGDSSFSSVSGDIDVELAPGVETHVYDLQSVSGSITIGRSEAQRGLRMGSPAPWSAVTPSRARFLSR